MSVSDLGILLFLSVHSFLIGWLLSTRLRLFRYLCVRLTSLLSRFGSEVRPCAIRPGSPRSFEPDPVGAFSDVPQVSKFRKLPMLRIAHIRATIKGSRRGC